MTDHTPGPWAASCGGQGESFAVKASTRTLALVKTCRNQAQANARLIAAAPDLLRALERFVSVVTMLPPHLLETPLARTTLTAAKAAIEKAKGATL